MSIYFRDCLKESKDSHGCHSPGGKVIPQIAGPKNCGPECCSTPSTPLNAALVARSLHSRESSAEKLLSPSLLGVFASSYRGVPGTFHWALAIAHAGGGWRTEISQYARSKGDSLVNSSQTLFIDFHCTNDKHLFAQLFSFWFLTHQYVWRWGLSDILLALPSSQSARALHRY